MEKRDFKELRCKGENKRGRECNQLLYKYQIKENEMVIVIKCPSCNTFSVLHLPFECQK